MDYRTADLSSLIGAVNNIAAETRTAFGQLSSTQLNWKPSAERWSVAQCFDHLLNSNKGYFPVIDSVLAGKKRTMWESVPVLPGVIGKLFIKTLDPASTRKIKAPQKFQPAQSSISATVLDDFVAQQSQIAEKMKATSHLDLDRLVITSPALAVVTYSLLDAYRIIVVHEARHFQQAKRVTEESTFPV